MPVGSRCEATSRDDPLSIERRTEIRTIVYDLKE
jgi:hypothetical protein